MKIETEQLSDAVSRLHKAQGQLGGILKMLESGRDCTQIRDRDGGRFESHSTELIWRSSRPGSSSV